ncbi:hypothetical protein [Lactococcus allomyrinae]|uniref:Uncharacterized protein n=1 Tax=Lactococcus allomyrinae TaxID=2419773 RepID=A0A387BGB1_9LACT|nr:hypothetical protein [Lactococcus allomyrinae]AYG00037.1 hypothetical protein D7I46_02400 [Lactococcus allomyrinae]
MSNNYQARTRKKSMTPLLILTIMLAIIFGAGGFAGGYFVGQSHANSKTSANFTKGQSGGFAGNRQNGDMGTVSAISSSSITIKTRSGSSETFTINSSTSVQEAQMGQGPNQDGTSSSSSDDSSNGASLNDVTTDSNVVIVPTNSTSKTAKTIMLMPSGMGNNGNSTAENQ